MGSTGQKPTTSGSTPSSYSCEACRDTGVAADDGLDEVECGCVRRGGEYEPAIRTIPHAHREGGVPTLEGIEPRSEKQRKLLEIFRRAPDESYLIVGPEGSGKTRLALALLEHAARRGRPAAYARVPDLMEQFRRFEVSRDAPRPVVLPDDYEESSPRRLLLLDDFEQAKATEFQCEMMYRLLNQARDWSHQIVVTTTKTPEELKEIWGRARWDWGTGIVQRLAGCKVKSFFPS